MPMVQSPLELGVDRALSRADRDWVSDCVGKIEADFNRSSDTHLIKVALPCLTDVDLYLKDESTHPSGSLKHRLARTQIEFYGGECRLVEAREIYDEARNLADRLGGHYVDQFTHAERATDWRGNNNIAESVFTQMAKERFPVPSWVVVSAGTGGTSSTIGRYIRYRRELLGTTRLCAVDPENSVFFDFFSTGNKDLRTERGSRIEGIGRPRVEPSFLPSVIDRMMRIPDAASIATIWWLERVLGKKCGGSTGTNVFGALNIIAEMLRSGDAGSVVTMICDPGERYLRTYYDRGWIQEQGFDLEFHIEQLETFAMTGDLR